MRNNIIFLHVFVLLALTSLTGCMSPKYVRPALSEPVPVEYKEEGGWKTATPGDSLDRGDWWARFGDPVLSGLIVKANGANQNIAIAAANFRQARTQIPSARSAFLPGVNVTASAERSDAGYSPVSSRYAIGATSSWEVSFWNAIPAFEAAKAMTEASAADYATMRLSIQAEVAQTYFQIATMDEQVRLYERTLSAYAKAVRLTKSQHQGGIATPADVAQAETQLAAAEAELGAIKRNRAELENALAVLTGQLPSTFKLPATNLAATLPPVPYALPSTLLERRPDVAAAERQVMVANEQIGIARGAWFLSLTLGGSRGFLASPWTEAAAHTWAFGPSAALSIFQGGQRVAQNDAAWAGFEAAVAAYRQTVLQAFQEVENNISGLRYMEDEAKARARAVTASNTAVRLSLAQYEAGLTTYLQVVATQTTALANQRQALHTQGQQLVATVTLIKALGGGFDPSTPEKMRTGLLTPLEGKAP